jgi:hypothetical protein
MEILIEIIFGRIIIRFFGVYTRYFFFFLIGKRKNIKYLSGNTKEHITSLSQDFSNAVVGLISFSFTAIGIAYLVFR